MANDFKNVSVIKLSPYSPELNPIEQVWRWLRQRYLATNLLLITTTSSPKSAMHEIGFWIAPKESPNAFVKMDRPNQLIFKVSMTSLGRENDK
ncbi:TPA: transposase, partial [Vibrio parahaemolyticus]|nr:transposase [Vibrio parahaemolyticus]HCE1499887.1 transposase [Vibrio parahaemolyticus]HCE1572739.1 transposase [Vibrio parahaemolyticus]HCE1965022.1 transposase [Vibrio parahaemolyticus]HCE3042372.1 transposase [Vibrio parahaemolyticus]